LSFVGTFNDLKRIYGFCPCCDEPFRLSDALLFTAQPPPKTAFDRVADAERRLVRAENKFDEAKEAIKQAARERGQKAALRRLRRISPSFGEMRINPMDVKILFDPVDYIAFPGLSNEKPGRITFIDAPAANSEEERIQSSIEKAIDAGNLEWCTLRIGDEGTITRK
jgi:predicted Holliday junction resolvase-like endonuclease